MTEDTIDDFKEVRIGDIVEIIKIARYWNPYIKKFLGYKFRVISITAGGKYQKLEDPSGIYSKSQIQPRGVSWSYKLGHFKIVKRCKEVTLGYNVECNTMSNQRYLPEVGDTVIITKGESVNWNESMNKWVGTEQVIEKVWGVDRVFFVNGGPHNFSKKSHLINTWMWKFSDGHFKLKKRGKREVIKLKINL
jgi:hypothetical protein